jgi:hypothetical protein
VASSTAEAEPSPAEVKTLGLRRLDALSPLYELPIFSPAFCAQLNSELAHFEQSGLPMGRPNSMNRHGVLLSELGFGPLLNWLLAEYLRPIAAALFPHAGGATLDSHRSFTVKYGRSAEESLALHYDNSEVTLNVCVGEAAPSNDGGGKGAGLADAGFEGGELLFGGLCSDRVQEPKLVVAHSIGRGLLHLGRQMHQALPVTDGTRVNLIMWCRSDAHRRAHGCPMCGRTDLLMLDPPEGSNGGPCGPCSRGANRAGGGVGGETEALLPSAEQIADFMKG